MNLTKRILVTISELTKNNFPRGKTSVQKIIYFSLPYEIQNKLYKPYYYGPFSEKVQEIIRSLLNTEDIIYNDNELELRTNSLNNYKNDRETIDKVIEFLRDRGITKLKSITNFSKIHYLYFHGKKKTVEDIKKTSKFLGWKHLLYVKNEKIENYIELAKEINN